MSADGYMDFDVYVNGEPVVIRGLIRHGTEDEVVVDFVEDPEVTTTTVTMADVKCEGGLSALLDHLFTRGLIPAWYYDGREIDEWLGA